MTDTPVLAPGEPLRFIFAHGSPAVWLIQAPEPPVRFDTAARWSPMPEPIRCYARLHRSPALGWDGMVLCADGDERRLFVALRMAEIAILFCEMVGTRVRCAGGFRRGCD